MYLAFDLFIFYTTDLILPTSPLLSSPLLSFSFLFFGLILANQIHKQTIIYMYISIQVEGNRRQNALESTLRRHDVVAMTERRRRNLIQTNDFEGCRCSYHPTNDGCGDYPAL